LAEFCSKGSLADVLDNNDIDLTWIFKFSFINDLLEGLDFLQKSRFGYHGCLSSVSCLITGKWELKIADYGLSKVYRSQIDPAVLGAMQKASSSTLKFTKQDTILASSKYLLWMAPETVLSTPIGVHIVKPTKRGDIYRYIQAR
jgi:serine/threonine protein kinase